MPSQIASAPAAASLSHLPAFRRGAIPAGAFVGLLRGLDVCILLAVGALAGYGIARPLGAALPEMFPPCVAGAAFATVYCRNRVGLYAMADLCAGRQKRRASALALIAGAVVLGAGVAASDDPWHTMGRPLAALLGVWLAGGGLALGLMRAGAGVTAKHLVRTRQLGRRVALVGSGAGAAAFMALLDRAQPSLLHVVGLYRDRPGDGEAGPSNLPNLGAVRDLVADGQHGQVDAVMVTLRTGDAARMAQIAAMLRPLATEVAACPCEAGTPDTLPEMAGLPVAVLSRPPLSDWQRYRKRAVDVAGSAVLLAFLAPVLLAIALLVKAGSAGPVLFRQTRIGYHDQPFLCLKFRTMYDHATDLLADRQTTRDDPRVTRIGRLLRRTSLDELPQLVNVLLGDMSLVGPRPHAPNTRAEGRFFADVVSNYAMRHRVKPGITGWAQVNGWRGETATVDQIEQRVRHDLYYIRNWSLVFDIRILLMTAIRGFSSKQAY